MAKAPSKAEHTEREDNPTPLGSSSKRQRGKAKADAGGGIGDVHPQAIATQLTYNEARTALELSLAELQASDLDVEAMAGLYRRAEAYAERCEQLLNQVEQDVLLWTDEDPSVAPRPYTP